METYLVGGAVRDKLLGIDSKDHDYVVVNSSEQEMLDLGFEKVGSDFPVFLHPVSKDEYALARTERLGTNYSNPYQNFIVETNNVTLEEDLSRRDLTINSLAMNDDGSIIDYFGGLNDLNNKVLKHTSHAFADDPVRILRTCRFAARYYDLGFKIHEETMFLMVDMINKGLFDNVKPERIMLELRKGLMEKNPQVMLVEMNNCGILKKVMPEIDVLFENKEIISNVLSEMKKTSDLNLIFEERYACLINNIGVGDNTTLKQVEDLNKKLKVTKFESKLSRLVMKYHKIINNFKSIETVEFVKMLDELKVIHDKSFLLNVLNCSKAIYFNKNESNEYPQYDFFIKLADLFSEIDIGEDKLVNVDKKYLRDFVLEYKTKELESNIKDLY